MIKNIIFDVGNVLAIADWPKVFERVGIEPELYEPLARATVRSSCWNEFDRGVMSDEEIINGCIAIAPEYEKQIRLLFAHLDRIVEVPSYSAQWLKSFKDKGYRVYILSNFARTAFEACRPAFDFLKYADGEVVSYQVKEVKPDKAIYDCLCSKYNILPEESVFTDDLPANIEAAVSYGFHGVVFKNYQQADEEINEICQRLQTRS